MNIGKVGENGEKRVAEFLRKNGFSVVKRNYQCRYGEIDIIAESKQYILFVEVKTRKENALISGIEAVNSHKQQRTPRVSVGRSYGHRRFTARPGKQKG